MNAFFDNAAADRATTLSMPRDLADAAPPGRRLRRQVRQLLVSAILTCGGIALATSAQAQVPELLSIQSEVALPRNGERYEGLWSANYRVRLSVPIPIGERVLLLIPGLSFDATDASLDGITDPPTFYSPGVQLTTLFYLPQRWALVLRGALTLGGDYVKVDAQMLRGTASVLALRRWGDVLFGFGGAVSAGFERVLPVPLVQVRWTPNTWFAFDTVLPSHVATIFRLGHDARYELGLRLEADSVIYGVRMDRVSQRWPCAVADDGREADPSQCGTNVAQSSVRLGLTAAARIRGDWWVSFFGGGMIYRDLEVRNAAGETLHDANGSTRAGVLRIAVALRLPSRPQPTSD